MVEGSSYESTNVHIVGMIRFTTSCNVKTLRALFTNCLTPMLTRELYNQFDDWLEATRTTNHPVCYIICGLTRELKIW